MYIIDNKNKTTISEKISKFTIVFTDREESRSVARELKLLASDDWVKIWQAFEGKKAKELLSSAIDGLIVFLSCERDKNVITGEFFSLDRETDAALLTHYVHEAEMNATVDIEGMGIAT